MRMPQKPPTSSQLWESVTADPARFQSLIQSIAEVARDDTYLHWDDLRYRKPPKDLSREEWWFALKTRRNSEAMAIPLEDLEGRPFVFGAPLLVQQKLLPIDQQGAGQIRMPTKLANEDMQGHHVFRSLAEEAITSSQLEGAATTRIVAKAMIRSRKPPMDQSERMIMNNYHVMERLCEVKDQPMSEELLCELHTIITEGTFEDACYEGKIREPGEDVGVGDWYNEIYHAAPPAEQLPRRLRQMCEFANGKTPGYFVHPVIRATILHFWLAYDHPYIDGNGRCARALFYWSMLNQGYWLCEYISISEIIRRAPVKYGRAFLHTETDENDLTYFILHHLDIVTQAIAELDRVLSRKTRELTEIEAFMRSTVGFNHRQLALLSHSLRNPNADFTALSHKRSHRVVDQTARNDLYQLVKKGLLDVRKIGRVHHYHPASGLEAKLRLLR